MFTDFLIGFLSLCVYFIFAASIIVALKLLLKPPKEYIRKMMHTVCFLSIFMLTYAFDQWFLAAGAGVLFALLVYPILALFERHPQFAPLFNQRRKGEVKLSLMLVFFMMASMIALFWGLMGENWKYIVIVAVLAWGFGDAAAALVGKKYGRSQVRSRLVEGTKTWEGCLAMYVVSACAIFVSLLFYEVLPWYQCVLAALLVAAVSALSELVSHKGMDTVNVPFATALPLFGLMYLFMNWSF